MHNQYAVCGPCGPGSKDRGEVLGRFDTIEEATEWIRAEIAFYADQLPPLREEQYHIVDTLEDND